jgi:hypothetical protein
MSIFLIFAPAENDQAKREEVEAGGADYQGGRLRGVQASQPAAQGRRRLTVHQSSDFARGLERIFDKAFALRP